MKSETNRHKARELRDLLVQAEEDLVIIEDREGVEAKERAEP